MKCYICGCDLSHWDYYIGNADPSTICCDDGNCINKLNRLRGTNEKTLAGNTGGFWQKTSCLPKQP